MITTAGRHLPGRLRTSHGPSRSRRWSQLYRRSSPSWQATHQPWPFPKQKMESTLPPVITFLACATHQPWPFPKQKMESTLPPVVTFLAGYAPAMALPEAEDGGNSTDGRHGHLPGRLRSRSWRHCVFLDLQIHIHWEMGPRLDVLMVVFPAWYWCHCPYKSKVASRLG
ncbi:hypothetical protein BJ508DRAFT_314526 [Ascobolus immersus RN42]|uniref:Uncharacterized protein n=1 Tax=Ascobolus immersus RN42 TaxID=1160509 RepID=A0A3N4HES9_ASCIM|nr:hypothetical protein BJ508DRAFT_316137 [Ascobolus immersus RN42]RPA72695.1 hypothetical protein BJ508DRAFT_314526 [Ascobolus immersus RN42]